PSEGIPGLSAWVTFYQTCFATPRTSTPLLNVLQKMKIQQSNLFQKPESDRSKTILQTTSNHLRKQNPLTMTADEDEDAAESIDGVPTLDKFPFQAYLIQSAKAKNLPVDVKKILKGRIFFNHF